MLRKVDSVISSVEDIVKDLKNKKLVILVDDENRENEGDLVFPAEYITPEIVNFMSQYAKGLICVSLNQEFIDRLDLPQMISEQDNHSKNKTAFTVSVESSKGVSTGISAADRSKTIQVLADPSSTPRDLIRPGHVFPIRAQKGGVLKRAGHTEASADFCQLAGLRPAAVICEIIHSDGTMARMDQLKEFSKKHGIKIGTIESLIQYRMENGSFIEEKTSFSFPTQFGKGFKAHVYWDPINEIEHLAFVKGDISSDQVTLVRMHTECIAGDVFGGLTTNSHEHLEKAFRLIDQNQSGIVVYLRSKLEPTRSFNRVHARTNPDKQSTPLDSKDYGIGAQILRSLKVKQIKLLTNSNTKRVGIKGYGLEIVDTQSMDIKPPLSISTK